MLGTALFLHNPHSPKNSSAHWNAARENLDCTRMPRPIRSLKYETKQPQTFFSPFYDLNYIHFHYAPGMTSPIGFPIFTDASAWPNGHASACAVWLPRHLHGILKLPHFCTIFQAELFGISLALSAVLRLATENCRIFTISSDCEAAIKYLSDYSTGGPSLKLSCIRLLHQIETRGIEVHLNHVKAHTELNDLLSRGNRYADLTAKSIHNLDLPISDAEVPKSFTKTCIKRKQKTKFAETWRSKLPHLSRATQLLLPTLKAVPACRKFLMSGSWTPDLTSYLTGHGFHAAFMAKMYPSLSPNCNLCEAHEEQTIEHLILKCKGTANTRARLGIRGLQDILENGCPKLPTINAFAKATTPRMAAFKEANSTQHGD